MKREELTELHYIAPIANVTSILARGILSHEEAETLSHISVADEEVQGRRSKIVFNTGRTLHQYVNLYITARNPMLYRLMVNNSDVCVLRINPAVLDLPGTIVSTANAAGEFAKFALAPAGLNNVDRELVFATYWTSIDQDEKRRLVAIKCAEVLVPNRVESKYITGIYAACSRSYADIQSAAPQLSVQLDADLFFNMQVVV